MTHVCLSCGKPVDPSHVRRSIVVDGEPYHRPSPPDVCGPVVRADDPRTKGAA